MMLFVFNILSELRMHRLLSITILSTLLYCNLSYAGPPPGAGGGPPAGASKKNCNNALTAINIQNLDFGTFDASISGTVTIATDGSRTATGGVFLAGGTPAAAIFEVNSSLTGCEIYPVSIKLPNTATLTEPIGSTMTATNFLSLPATNFIITPGVPQLIEVGADLTVVAGQTGATYDTLTSYSLTFRH